MRPRPVVGEATVPDAVRRLLDKFDYPDHEAQQQVIPILSSLGAGNVGEGARIHLKIDATQNIAVNGENISWTSEDLAFDRLAFAKPTYPTETIVIPKAGYYGVLIKNVAWTSWTSGGTVRVIRTRDGIDTTVQEWIATSGSRGGGLAAPIPCMRGDTIKMFVDADDSSTQDLSSAEMNIYLIDREADTDWELYFELTDRWAITYDTLRESWFTTDYAAGADPGLFELDYAGAVLNSYTGWDDGNGVPAASICASLVYVAGSLWGVGESDDPIVSEIDPSDGTVSSTFAPNTGGTHGWIGITHDDTNLWVADAAVAHDYVEEYTTGGAFQQQISMPGSHRPAGVTWDGTNFWVTTLGGVVLKLDTSLTQLDSIDGPPVTSNYPAAMGGGPYGDCHYRDGFLYVMTRAGLWRKAL